MTHQMRLYFFELLHGNRIAILQVAKKYGWLKCFRILFELKRRLWFKNPFTKINKNKILSDEEKASQRQVGPAFVLYDILTEMGYEETKVLHDIKDIVMTVATAFLKFNVPIIQQSDYQSTNTQQRMQFFKRITSRFFNADGELLNKNNNTLCFSVNKCLFAQYSHQLGYSMLANIFCSADRHFFETYQPNIRFERTVTLADDRKPCDFSFIIAIDKQEP